MRILGVILIILGLLGFILGGITYTQTETVADLGPLELEAKEERTVPITPIASGTAVVAGIVLVIVDSRRTRE